MAQKSGSCANDVAHFTRTPALRWEKQEKHRREILVGNARHRTPALDALDSHF
jgi:hypothetical protein